MRKTQTRMTGKGVHNQARIRVISMRYSSAPFKFFGLAFMILSSHMPSAASLTTRSSILESVFECLFRRSLSQLF
jgi:hypothetical protein